MRLGDVVNPEAAHWGKPLAGAAERASLRANGVIGASNSAATR